MMHPATLGFPDRGKDMTEIETPEALREHFGPVNPLAERKVLTRLDAHCRNFIALSPFLVLATADRDGRVDASPRGDAPGFVLVPDDTTLILPDRRGNNRVDSFGNVLAAPGVGLIFFVPGIGETLRVNGTARIVTERDLLAPMAVDGKVPAAGLLITVQEAFFHCAKALIRSNLWDSSRHVDRASFPSLGRIIADQTRFASPDEAERSIEEGYRTRLY
jgi:PPOX class probable FMN-dependent enzyme